MNFQNRRPIYFDHNATSPYSPSVKEYLKTGMLEDWSNPSSIYPQAQVLEQRIRECGSFVAERLNCSPKHLFWTSGGTESINTILSLETLKLNQLSGFITSPLEHHASLKKFEYLGCSGLKVVSHNDQGELDLNLLEEVCAQNPHSLLSFLSANNETGVTADIKAISKIARKYDCLVHVDAVQSLGKEPLDLEAWDVDFASFSGHKIGAMKGVGLLYARRPFAPLMFGGGQERGMRPGTYNFPAIYSFKKAVQDIDLSKQKYVQQLRDDFEKQFKCLWNGGDETSKSIGLQNGEATLAKQKPSSKSEISRAAGLSNEELDEASIQLKSLLCKVNCARASRLPNTSNIYCGVGISNQAVLLHLARKGICVSTGSACSAGSPTSSHVMAALALASKDKKRAMISQKEELDVLQHKALNEMSHTDYAGSCLRVSFAPSNTKKEVDFLIQSLKEFYSTPYI